MNFLIFRDFFQIFLNLFSIFNVKNNLKMAKKGVYFRAGPRGCDMALRATWQSHTDPRECLHSTM